VHNYIFNICNPEFCQREVEAMLGIILQEIRVYREIKQEGIQQGEKSLILRQLHRRVGELASDVRQLVESLPLEQLENLGEALLDFTSMTDLQAWLAALES
jgi:predicted transposase YdaD